MQVSKEDVLSILRQVKDPEIPVLDVVEMGIVREVRPQGETGVEVDITPTYSGCPAMHVIEREIEQALSSRGFSQVKVNMVYAPAWTSEWLTEEAKQKLEAYGIAPPRCNESVRACPFCGSKETELRSEFGSTPCKALCYCTSCQQPFEYFKVI